MSLAAPFDDRCDATRDDVVRHPTAAVGVSGHHRQFDGTLRLTEETYDAVVRETLASVASHADAGESSVMLHLRDELVDVAAFEAGAPEAWGEQLAGAEIGLDTLDISASGATGHPTPANADADR